MLIAVSWRCSYCQLSLLYDSYDGLFRHLNSEHTQLAEGATPPNRVGGDGDDDDDDDFYRLSLTG